ncbi:MAG: WG repeat-containing protein [Pyrinomonadaceae bacterium]
MFNLRKLKIRGVRIRRSFRHGLIRLLALFVLISYGSEISSAFSECPKLYVVSLPDATCESGRTLAYFDVRGEMVFNGKCKQLFDFAGGYGQIELSDDQVGFIDSSGKINAMPEGLWPVCEISDGVGIARYKDRHWIFDLKKDSLKLLDVEVDSSLYRHGICSSGDGILSLPIGGGRMQFFDSEGNKLFVVEDAHDVVWAFKSGMAVLRSYEDGDFVIDRKGRKILGPNPLASMIVGEPLDGLVEFNERKDNDELKGSKYFDEAGKLVVSTKYTSVGSYSEGLVRFTLRSKWGYIDKNGEVAIDPKFLWAEDFSEGLAAAKTENRFGYIDKTGTFKIEPRFLNAEQFKCGVAEAYTGSEFGLIDLNGNWIWKKSR